MYAIKLEIILVLIFTASKVVAKVVAEVVEKVVEASERINTEIFNEKHDDCIIEVIEGNIRGPILREPSHFFNLLIVGLYFIPTMFHYSKP